MRSVAVISRSNETRPRPTGSSSDDVPSLPISALSKRTGCNIETIRFYEKIAMLPEVERIEDGDRIYNQRHAERLSFIRRARALGFTLDEVRTLLALSDTHEQACANVKEVASAHLANVRRKINDLRAMEEALDDLVSKCGEGIMNSGTLIEALLD